MIEGCQRCSGPGKYAIAPLQTVAQRFAGFGGGIRLSRAVIGASCVARSGRHSCGSLMRISFSG